MTRSTWRRIRVSDLVASGEAEVKTGPFGTQLHASDYVESGTPVINVRNIGFGGIRADKLEYIADETVRRLSGHVLHPGDIVFGRKGAVERHVLIRDRQSKWFQGSDCLRLRLRTNRVLPQFLSYYLLTRDHQTWMMQQCSHGATMASLNQDIVGRIEFAAPDPDGQEAIASILSAYDDLIENNARRIAILEEMARRIYDEWFVRFRFPGHEGVRMVESESGLVPEGWAAMRFEELLDSWRGGDWGSEEESDADTAPVFVIRGTDFGDLAHGTGNRVPARFIEPKSLEKRKLKPFDVVVENSINAKSRSAGKTLLVTPGLLNRLGGDAIAASFCKVFRFRDPTLAPLAHLKMRQLFEAGDMAFFQNVAANGIANFQATRFVSTQFVTLPIDVLRRRQILEIFNTLTRSTYADAISNLRRTRDLLLPKLISGELDVSALPEPEALAA